MGTRAFKAAFLAYFMQQKKYVKDPVEIYSIKQRDGETIEEFMERFKIETGHIKGAPECMRIYRFMHGVNNPELTKRLNERVPKTVEEMMTATMAFIRGETAAASKKKVHTPWKSQDQSKWHTSKRRSDFQTSQRMGGEGPLVIETEIGGHAVHRVYVNGGSSMKKQKEGARTPEKYLRHTKQRYKKCGGGRDYARVTTTIGIQPVLWYMVKKHDGS
ncbi:reverse transcriptase domain-containing protein [Tanacetum coccineum]